MTRIADIAQNKAVTNLILDTQSRLNDKQAQISSNQKSQDYAGIAPDSMQLVSLEASERRMEQYLTDNVYVDLTRDNKDDVFVFNGWMFSSSPSIAPFDHPVYDIWLVDCY